MTTIKTSKIANYQILLFSILFLLFFILPSIINFITDLMWFKAVDFSEIFLKGFAAKIVTFSVFFSVFFIFTLINILIARKIKRSKFVKFEIYLSVLFAFLAGTLMSSNWITILSYFNKASFNLIDPIFAKDVSFYVFALPYYTLLWKFSIGLLVFIALLTVIHYFETLIMTFIKSKQYDIDPNTGIRVENGVDIKSEFKKIRRAAVVHTAILGAFLFFLLSIGNYLVKYAIMYSKQGIVVGAGYVDLKVILPFINFLMIFSFVITILFIVWIIFLSKHSKLGKKKYLMILIGAYFVLSIIVMPAFAALIQGLIVNPNELNLEKPYIENNIKFTKEAYGISDIEESFFEIEELTKEVVVNQKETILNARILDYRPLEQTYKQTQEIRLYYDLGDIDIDRYDIDGEYKQVMLAPRELDQNKLSANAKKWINLHLTFTHGMGIVMSPVNTVTNEGLPNYLIKDIPPSYTVEEESIIIDEPRIYYGEKDNEYIIVGTTEDEFDYSEGDLNKYSRYDGEGGVKLDSFFKKLLFAIKFSDINILISPTITKDSKIMYKRNIHNRIKEITPFLSLDRDPYIVISEGKLYWIQDAYTTTGNFPYSEKLGDINYIRNSVKVVVDAYNGDVTYYLMENDPIIKTYSNIFKNSFKSFDDMPEDLKKHIRYPVDLFQVQSEIYAQYHMNDVTVFYNKEDLWEIPTEVYQGNQIQMEPYYIITTLPKENKEEFVLMTPFTPVKKDNMISWFAARSDGDNYGKLVLFKFPKDRLVYGPLQVEAKIDQDSEISQQLTLWSQQGSRVTRGNLLVIPLDDSIIYIEPLYIQSELGQLPELKRILISDGERVVMEESISKAIESLFDIDSFGEKIDEAKKKLEDKKDSGNSDITLSLDDSKTEELIKKAEEYYNNVDEAMKEGDWEGIGENLDKLGEVLEKLNE